MEAWYDQEQTAGRRKGLGTLVHNGSDARSSGWDDSSTERRRNMGRGGVEGRSDKKKGENEK